MLKDADVIIIGSGFGAAVATLRFSEAGKRVIVLERGGWISREKFEADDDMMWQPEKGRLGMNDFKKRGRHILPWVGAAVGGGSHVYAGTLKRRDFFDDFPSDISPDIMAPYYDRAEEMMQAVKYPNHPPYNQLPSFCIFREAEQQLIAERPDIVEEQGNVLIAVSFASEHDTPGATFINKYGAKQRYADPEEQKILGGDIDVKNSLDKNYLHIAQKHGAVIMDFTEAVRIEPLSGGGYRIHWIDPRKVNARTGSVSGDILICSAGSIGSTELLLQNKYIYKSLPRLSSRLGKTYFTNGDYVTFLLPKRGLILSWLGLIAAITGFIISNNIFAVVGIAAYLIGWLISAKKAEPDKGTTNSDYIRFKHRDGSTQGVYIEGGRYPTPIKLITSIIMSLLGVFKPNRYGAISGTVNWMGRYVPVFELLERTWPVPLLMMGRDDAKGSFRLNNKGKTEIDFPFEKNNDYVKYLETLGRLLARRADSYFIPNYFAKIFKLVEVPHSLGGVPMGTNINEGVVDSYGRVFGYKNFLVLDGSIMPNSLGPNPANTILAIAERSMEKIIHQLKEGGEISTS